MPDGSDSTQSPAPPPTTTTSGEWPRRMWAGGEVFFSSRGRGRGRGDRLLLGEAAVCEEEVVGVERKGSSSSAGVVGGGGGGTLAKEKEREREKEKVFVWFERRYYGGLSTAEAYSCCHGGGHQWEELKSRLVPAVRERRCLVFMKRDEGNHSAAQNMERKIVRRKFPHPVFDARKRKRKKEKKENDNNNNNYQK